MGHMEHKKKSPSSVSVSVITVSDTRKKEKDYSGLLIKRLLEENGHKIQSYQIIKDEPADIDNAVNSALKDENVQAVILTGGTGLSSRDNTYESVKKILEKEIQGFGEVFRSISFREIGASAILSRTIAGVAHKTVIISLPGSEQAVKLAMENIILTELGHMVYEVNR